MVCLLRWVCGGICCAKTLLFVFVCFGLITSVVFGFGFDCGCLIVACNGLRYG